MTAGECAWDVNQLPDSSATLYSLHLLNQFYRKECCLSGVQYFWDIRSEAAAEYHSLCGHKLFMSQNDIQSFIGLSDNSFVS